MVQQDALLEDERPITAVLTQASVYLVGAKNIESFRVTLERGHGAFVVWFEALDGDGAVLRRINSALVESVEYV